MFKDNPDFYPTPSKLISRMLNKIDWKGLKTVLEPSAGSGVLVEAIHNKFNVSQYHYKKDKYDIDSIEIDPNLQNILKSNGHRVIFNDFLHFSTYKSYDCIIANFPFSVGDKHALKAIHLIETQMRSGQLCFLLNSETLRNPYSNIRKELKRKLEEYNAEIEFIENAFSEAERRTNVEIALVYMQIDKINNDSVILNDLKQEEKIYFSEHEYKSDQLIQSDFIKGIVDQYNYEVKAGLKLIDEYNKIKPYMLKGFGINDMPILKLELECGGDENNLENAYIKQIRLKYWKALFSNDQFMGLFTSNLKRKYIDHVDELKDYDFSLYNIYTIRIELSKEMIKGVEDTILNLFEEFSHKHYYDEQSKNIHLYNGWKTNKAYKINKKVIIPLSAYRDLSYSWGRYEPTHYNVLDKLKDIEKVFNYLDDGKSADIDITETLKFAEGYGETSKIQLKYFMVTFYKKGTCHIEFTNTELLKKFNLFAGKTKMWIPGNFGKTPYNEMSKEERNVVDSFCGKEEYNKIMNNSQYYLYEPSKSILLIGSEGVA